MAIVKMAVFWSFAPCSLMEVYDVLEVHAAFIIRAITAILSNNVDYDYGADHDNFYRKSYS